MDSIIQCAICIFDNTVDYIFLRKVLKRRNQPVIFDVIILMITGIIQFGVNQYNSSICNFISFIVLETLMIILMFQANWKDVLIYCSIITTLVVTSEFVTSVIYLRIVGELQIDALNENAGGENIGGTMIAILLRYIGYVLIWKNTRLNKSGKNNIAVVEIVYPIMIVLIIFIRWNKVVYSAGENYGMEWSGLLLMVLGAFSFIYIAHSIDLIRKNERYKRAEEVNALNIERFKELEREEKAWKEREHDLTKNLAAIGGLAKEKRDEEILSVLEGMQLKIAEIKENDYINNSVINALLKVKISEADREGIAVDFYAEPDMDFAGYDIGDIIAIIGNQLDNAIEASRMCDGEKKIWARYYCAENKQIVLEMENYFTSVPRKSLGKFLTSKQDTTRHGMGMSIIQETAEKNGGFAENTVKDSVFRSVVVLPKER